MNEIEKLLKNSKVWFYLKDTYPKEKRKELMDDFVETLNDAINVNNLFLEVEKNNRIENQYCSKCGMKVHPIVGAHCHSPTCPHEYYVGLEK